MDNPYPFDLLCRKRCNLLLRVSYQSQASNTTAISECEVLAIGFQLPAGLFVLHASSIVLETWITFLAWLVLLAVVIEAGNSKPCSICTGLTGLGIETNSKGIVFRKNSTIALKIILADTAFIHPQAQTLVSDELHYSDGFVDSHVLCFRAI